MLKKKEKNSQVSEYLGSQNKSLYSTKLQFKKSSAQKPVHLDKNFLSSKNWRFIGSPHLLFSFFFLHTHLQRVLSFVTQICNKNVVVNKEFVKQNFYKVENWNNTSTQSSKETRCCSNYSTLTVFRGFFNLPTISSLSKYCAINTFAIKNRSRVCQVNKKEGLLLDTFKIELFLNIIRQPFQNNNGVFTDSKYSQGFASQRRTVTDIHNFFGKDLVRVLTEVYNNSLTLPWFNPLKKDKRFSKNQEFPLLFSSLVIKDEKSLLCVLFSDLLLYSLLIKKEVVCRYPPKKQVELNNQLILRVSPASVAFSKKHKTFDYQVSPFSRFFIPSSRALVGNSRPSKVGHKNFSLSENFDFTRARRIKPLHLEVSYQSLCAVYLFPPQRICLPVMVDVDCVAKAF